MRTVGTPTTRIVRLEESYSLNLGYTGGEKMPKGTIVKLVAATNKVIPVEAATDLPFGVLAVACTGDDKPCTVTVPFVMQLQAVAGAAIARGARVAAQAMIAEGVNPEMPMQYITAAPSSYASGVALTAAANSGDVITVGVYRTPYLN